MRLDKNILMMVVFVAILQLFVLDANAAPIPDDYCSPVITLLNQDPIPASPGEYVKVVFQVTDIDRAACNGTVFEILPDFPFSLDSGETKRSLDYDSYSGAYSNTSWMISYKLRVDDDAVEGYNELKVKYGTYSLGENHFFIETFDIDVENPKTSFDGVIQSTDGNEVAIAIANTGKNTANSMIVRVPEQDSFEVSGTDGQMIGNLDSGDYSTVAFTVTSKKTTQSPMMNGNESAKKSDEKPDMNSNLINATKNQKSNLELLISYTDAIGVRRNSTLVLPMSTTSSSMNMTGFQNRNKSSTPSWLIAAIVIVVLGVGWKVYKKMKENAEHKKQQKNDTPDWVKKERHSK